MQDSLRLTLRAKLAQSSFRVGWHSLSRYAMAQALYAGVHTPNPARRDPVIGVRRLREQWERR